MQGWRQPQPSRTNRPSSSGTAPRGPRDMRSGARSGHEDAPESPFLCAMRPPGHVRETPDTVTVGAAHRSAARAWGARPVPFRTRKLSPIAPRVLRGQPVGGQGAADRWTAPSRTLELRRGRPRGLPLFALYKPTFTLSVLGVFGLALVEGTVVVRGELSRSFAYVAFWWRTVGYRVLSPCISGRFFCSLFPVNQLRDVVSIKYTPPAGALSN